MSFSRREFLETAALAAAATPALAEADKKTGMPMRVLGRTGFKVSILGFGGGSRFLMYKDEDKAAEALHKALDLGINYVDSAATYGDGQSEERMGKFLGARRKDIWLVTKLSKRNGDEAMRQLERSLKLMRTDYLNLVHMHDLKDEKDLADIEAGDGVLKVLYKLRDQKVARNIGVTCHGDPAILKIALERHDLDCTQMALNAARQGQGRGGGALKPGEEAKPGSFETVALPVALKKKMGVTAMKVFAQEQLVGKAPIDKLLRYVWSLPVAAAMAGMPKLEYLEENIRLAKAFQPMPPAEMRFLSENLSERYKLAIDRHFLDHRDA
ncbi:MAG: aldo/keto reductase [Acidobacteria bacterium]|nr:aldo/keto reductase [Acidobacteriota bacterium]